MCVCVCWNAKCSAGSGSAATLISEIFAVLEPLTKKQSEPNIWCRKFSDQFPNCAPKSRKSPEVHQPNKRSTDCRSTGSRKVLTREPTCFPGWEAVGIPIDPFDQITSRAVMESSNPLGLADQSVFHNLIDLIPNRLASISDHTNSRLVIDRVLNAANIQSCFWLIGQIIGIELINP